MTEQFYDDGSGPEGSMILQLSNTAGVAPASAATTQTSHSRKLLNRDVNSLVGGGLGTEFVESYGEGNDIVEIIAWVEQLPDPDNRVALDSSKTDDRGNPVPELTWRLDDRSLSTLRAAERICRSVLETAGASDVRTVGTPSDPLLLSHQMGTTRIGTDPETSVVDTDLGVHDVSNLYVSSSGTFVTAGAANPTLTIAALTLRLADHSTNDSWYRTITNARSSRNPSMDSIESAAPDDPSPAWTPGDDPGTPVPGRENGGRPPERSVGVPAGCRAGSRGR